MMETQMVNPFDGIVEIQNAIEHVFPNLRPVNI